jgi:hypothetical protein
MFIPILFLFIRTNTLSHTHTQSKLSVHNAQNSFHSQPTKQVKPQIKGEKHRLSLIFGFWFLRNVITANTEGNL